MLLKPLSPILILAGAIICQSCAHGVLGRRSRFEICDDFDKKMANEKVVEVWTLCGDRQRPIFGGWKGGGFNFYEIWICEPNVCYTFLLFTSGLMDHSSLPCVKKGRWRRDAQGEVEIEMPIMEKRYLKRNEWIYAPTSEKCFVSPKNCLDTIIRDPENPNELKTIYRGRELQKRSAIEGFFSNSSDL